MPKPRNIREQSPGVFALIVGGFVWIVFDSVALGLVSGFATLFLLNRDAKDDADGHEDER